MLAYLMITLKGVLIYFMTHQKEHFRKYLSFASTFIIFEILGP